MNTKADGLSSVPTLHFVEAFGKGAPSGFTYSIISGRLRIAQVAPRHFKLHIIINNNNRRLVTLADYTCKLINKSFTFFSSKSVCTQRL